MTTMLEKMAAGMASELEGQIAPQIADHVAGKWGSAQSHFSGPSAIFGTCQVNGEVDVKALARAALLAIREPDRSVLNKGAFYHIDHGGAAGDVEISLAKQSFRAMIDAILGDEKP